MSGAAASGWRRGANWLKIGRQLLESVVARESWEFEGLWHRGCNLRFGVLT